jgi:tRNA 2-(methylsulfanyl)-N6-isopentenyladenosine37 hydroxylase
MLGLLVETDSRWAPRAAREVTRLLVDHAHCEMKAASNALSLSGRALEHRDVMCTLVDIAQEELTHFREVLTELERRDLTLGPPEEDWYAAELRRRVARDRKQHHEAAVILADRLLVGALIEARSCERFKLLEAALRDSDAGLSRFYGTLLASEARHHRVFVELAAKVTNDAHGTRERLAAVAKIEASVVAELRSEPTVHG